MEAGAHEERVLQKTMTFPYFDREVPVLFPQDGKPYIPMIELCKMLGLHTASYIPKWSRLVLWSSARKLPYSIPNRGKHIVWCLHRGALPFWCACFNWSLAPPVRREHLRQATGAWLKDVVQAHQLMLGHYRCLRRVLFAFLASYSDAETLLDRWEFHLSSSLDVASSRQLELLLSQGETLISEAAVQAREIVQEQAMAPVVDVVALDVDEVITEIDTLPLFPVVPCEEREQFFANMHRLVRWYRETAEFIGRV